MAGTSRVVLIGFSGAGKSTVARWVATRLGWSPVDTDQLIEQRFGMAIPDIFSQRGEAAFRDEERRVLSEALSRDDVVVATGGGAVTDPAAWGVDLLGGPGTLVVALDVSPETSLARLRRQAALDGGAFVRPLLASDDPLTRIGALKAERQAVYDQAAITMVVDDVPADLVAAEVADLVRPPLGGDSDLNLVATSGSSAIYARPGNADTIGRLTRKRWPQAQRAWLISDKAVDELHGERVARLLGDEGLRGERIVVPVGEGSKSWATVGNLYDRMLTGGVERGDVVVALGGGVIGDLAGFVAATCLRGVGLVQVPTSLLAMVDSSVGGKTGINHAVGKNLIGAFYQPPLVIVDPQLLRTLPRRELTSGWAEMIKHGLIQRSTPGGERGDLLSFMERNVASLGELGEPSLSYLIRRNIALKAAVVTADEREGGIRAYLNFGHTLGHAIEAAGYRLLHGEAIALGMRAAARLGVRVGTCDEATRARIERTLDMFGLPRQTDADPQRVLALVQSDKKRVAGTVRWVLPLTGGGVVSTVDVPPAEVVAALMEVLATGQSRE